MVRYLDEYNIMYPPASWFGRQERYWYCSFVQCFEGFLWNFFVFLVTFQRGPFFLVSPPVGSFTSFVKIVVE